MQKPDKIRLQHMLDAAQEAISFAVGKSREDLNQDRKLVLSLVKSIEIIGEAASKITEACKIQIPGIPWPDIIAMRHRLIHGYFDINLDIVWDTVSEELPGLVLELKNCKVM